MAFFVRQYRNVFPTNPDWLCMTPEQVIHEYWQIHYWELRKAGASEGDEAVQYEAAAAFESEMAERGLVNIGGRWIEVDDIEE